ncbi:putative bifunctional diguanylate cyclase/phosphodiesterase [Bosea thiooxidans]
MRLTPVIRDLIKFTTPLIVITMTMAAVSGFSLGILSIARAYTTGEGLWTKGQKDAVYFLELYADTGDPGHFRRFKHALAIPLADRTARFALEADPIDIQTARTGLLEGGNHPDDLQGMILLFRYFRWYGHVADAVGHWRATDALLDGLAILGEQIRTSFETGQASPERSARHREELFRLNARLTPLATAFSGSLGMAGRAIARVLIVVNIVVALLLIVLAVLRIRRPLLQRQQFEDELLTEKEAAQTTLAALGEAVVRTDAAGRVEYMNAQAERLLGWSSAHAVGVRLDTIMRLVDPKTGEETDFVDRSLQGEGGLTTALQKLVRPGGPPAIVSVVAAPIMVSDTRSGSVVVLHDRSSEDAYISQLAWQAMHDELTGLPNRRALEEALALVLSDQKRHGHHALIFLDLDQFKIVNDTCGHPAGDQLLRQVTMRLKDSLRSSDCLARFGGDEFAALIAVRTPEGAMEIGERLRQAVEALQFVWEGNSFRVSASVGLVNLDIPGLGVDEAFKAADIACYMAKEHGRNCVELYRPESSQLQAHLSEMASVQSIQRALLEDRFRFHAQEIRCLPAGDGSGFGVELLLRLEGEGGEMMLPGRFIPAAERYGLMPLIDRWVVAHAFEIVARWPGGSEGAAAFFTINLSGATFRESDFIDHVLAEAARTGLDPARVYFEITETAAINDFSVAHAVIQTLRRHGFRFLLDDFGAGMSSFGYLKMLPVDFLKIDGHFVRDMRNEPTDRAIITAIVRMAAALGKQTVAEQVEDMETLALLQELGVGWAQGYAIGRPRPVPMLPPERPGAEPQIRAA